MQAKVLCVGDALIDNFLFISNAARFCQLDRQKCQICFDSGAKILVDSTKFCLGGNACNVVVGLCRLQMQVALAAEIGDDEFSQKIVHGLQKEKINTELLVQTKNAQATFSVCLSLGGDRTLFVHHVKREHAFSLGKAQVDWVYLTSLGEKWEQTYASVLNFVKKTHAKLAFNPGSTQLKKGREYFKDILLATDILFVNREEAEEIVYGEVLVKNNPSGAYATLLQALQKLGPKIICITDGANGSYALDASGKQFTQPIIPCVLVEKTGAGDGFTSGFLAAILSEKTIQEALVYGAMNAAAVIEHVGAQEGLLTNDGLQDRLRKLSQ